MFDGKTYRLADLRGSAVIGKDGTVIRPGFGPQGEEELVSTLRRLAGR